MTTAATIRTSESCHWYDVQGNPVYEVAKKDGSGMRPATLADARKQNLVPSVTTVLRILDKPALNDWKVSQGVMAVMTTPKKDGESLDDFVYRVLQVERVQDQEASTARDRGTAIHAALEAMLTGQDVFPAMLPAIKPAAEAVMSRGEHVTAEKILVGDGYAGRTDLVQETAEHWIVWDFKSTKTLPDPKKGAWIEHKLQLSAYAAALVKKLSQTENTKPVRTANCYIATKPEEEGKYVICEHDPNWHGVFQGGFQPVLKYWQWVNRYAAQQ